MKKGAQVQSQYYTRACAFAYFDLMRDAKKMIKKYWKSANEFHASMSKGRKDYTLEVFEREQFKSITNVQIWLTLSKEERAKKFSEVINKQKALLFNKK